jgi:DNA-binding transcriptional LysR family regulator
VAIRIGELADTELHARRIGTAYRICVASPRYLKEFGTPKTPADLRAHNCILYTLLTTGATWPFEGMPVKVRGRVSGNSPEVVTTMALRGMGIAMAPAFADALASGELCEILEDWPVPGLPGPGAFERREARRSNGHRVRKPLPPDPVPLSDACHGPPSRAHREPAPDCCRC